MHRLAPIGWDTFTGLASAQIDSAGSSASFGSMTNHASLGSSFATGNDLLAVDRNKSGQSALLAHELH